MSRDPSGIYSYPDGTRGSPGTTIFSARYNTFLDDLAVTLNAKLPVNMGGTGADNAIVARDNLDVERAMATVTNYDTHVWENGSFWSAVGATAAPADVGVFSGICYITNNDPNWITLEARDAGTGINYIRQKRGGTWSAWTQDAGSQAEADDRFVNVAGDTMTGPLVGTSITATSELHTGQNVISDSANLVLAGGGTGTGAIYLRPNGSNILTGECVIGPTGTLTTSRVVANSLQVNGSDTMSQIVPNGVGYAVLRQNVVGVREWYHGVHANGSFIIQDASAGITRVTIGFGGNLDYFGSINAYSGYVGRAGIGGTPGSIFNIFWTGAPQLWIDSTNVGNISLVSDYRIKKDVVDLPSTWAAVKALRPVKYTQAEFTAPAQKAASEPASGPMFAEDEVERWGFVAHELQETLIESAATGVKDSPDTIQSPNPFTLIAALTKALQEAMTRIEALEERS